MVLSPVDVTDVSSPRQLLSYALAGQLERLRQQRGDLSNRRVAEAARLGGTASNAAPVLTRAVQHGPSPDQLAKIDQVIAVLDEKPEEICALSSLCSRLSTDKHSSVGLATAPPSWTNGLLRERPAGESGVLAQASTLLSALTAAERVDARSVAALRTRYATWIDLLVRRLILMSVGPPSVRSYDAQVLLGGLASYAFELTRDRLESKVRYSPLAFRVWRSIIKQVHLCKDADSARELTVWLRGLLLDSENLRKTNINPGASLDVEVALAVPADWPSPDNDWVADVLRKRALDRSATIRERGTAAMGLWQRAIEHGRDLSRTRDELRDVIAELNDPDSRPDAIAGLRWVATTLRSCIEGQHAVCNEWPEVDELWFKNVQLAADELDNFGVPDHLLAGTKSLFRHMILQNAGGYRRQAIETVVTSGMTTPIARALGQLLKTEQEEAWVRIRAESALGCLQQRNPWIEADLTQACLTAYGKVRRVGYADNWVPRARITELHAALLAVGDCFGVPGAEERAETARDRLAPMLTELAEPDSDGAQLLRRPARAAAYLLTLTARPRQRGIPDLSEVLLKKMSEHRDEATARLSRWALSFRFSEDGSVRPLLEAVNRGAEDDQPY